MARETCPAMLMITSSPAPDSESSVTSVWRLSCHRPTTFALSRDLGPRRPQRRDGAGRMHSPNRRMYHAACASSAIMTVSFSGITCQSGRRRNVALVVAQTIQEALGGFWGDPRGQGRGNSSKDGEFHITRQGPGAPRQLACSVRNTLRRKDLSLAPRALHERNTSYSPETETPVSVWFSMASVKFQGGSLVP
jgi:hypothetical protein